MLIVSACAATATAVAAASSRPNIVLIFSDDHAWQAISAYEHWARLINTPHIDRLAREGMRFDRCLVPNPLCGPSRASVLTGTYSHVNGFYNNYTSIFDGSQPTFPKLLRAADYQTAIIGKWHLRSDPSGFDHWDILPGQGQYYNPVMIRNGERLAHTGHVSDIITNLSLDWLRQRDPGRPFLLMLHHKAPHRRWEPALQHLDHDNGRRYREPPTLFDDYSGRARVVGQSVGMSVANDLDALDLKLVAPPRLTAGQREKWNAYYEPRNAAFAAARLEGRELVRWKYQRYLHEYLACVRGIDESVGRVLDYIDQEGLAKNTLVVYASDQGFLLGEHGWFDKRWIFEESARTPLLVRWPGVALPGRVEKRIVSVIDFAQTFLEAAGVAAPERMQGRSLVPLLRREPVDAWRTSIYVHYYEYPGDCNVAPHYGVVTDRYKLVHYYLPGREEWDLYDREKDPLELHDFHDDPACAEVVSGLRRELARLEAELHVPAEAPAAAYGDIPVGLGAKPTATNGR